MLPRKVQLDNSATWYDKNTVIQKDFGDTKFPTTRVCDWLGSYLLKDSVTHNDLIPKLNTHTELNVSVCITSWNIPFTITLFV